MMKLNTSVQRLTTPTSDYQSMLFYLEQEFAPLKVSNTNTSLNYNLKNINNRISFY